ncbi:MAG: hypothetical protein ACO1N0_15470 [Fluviicola sp.]
MKVLILLALSLTFGNAFSQKDKEKILANFDYVEYYPDSTIKEARKFSKTHLNGTTVEFNPEGEPIAIGNYKKGLKTGKWLYSNGSYSFHLNHKDIPELHVCLTEHYDDRGDKTGEVRTRDSGMLSWEFQQEYERLLNPRIMKRICNMWVSVPNTSPTEFYFEFEN